MRYQVCRAAGFTLVELLAVVVIIAILAGVVAVNVITVTEDVPFDVARADFRAIEDAIKLFKFDTHRYPDSIDELIFGEDIDGWRGPYLDNPPLDPWKRPYVYEYTGGSPKPFEIKTFGADGKEDGEGGNRDLSSLDRFRDYAAK